MSLELNNALAATTIDDINQLEVFRINLATRISDLKKQRTHERREATKAASEQTRADAKAKRESNTAADKRISDLDADEKKEQKELVRQAKKDRIDALKKIKKLIVLQQTPSSIFKIFAKNHKSAKKTSEKVLSELAKLQNRILKKTEGRIAEELKDVTKAQRDAEKQLKAQQKIDHAAGITARKEAKIPKNGEYHAVGKYWSPDKIEAELEEKYWPTDDPTGKRDWNKWAYGILKQGGLTHSPEDLPRITTKYA